MMKNTLITIIRKLLYSIKTFFKIFIPEKEYVIELVFK